MTRTTRSGEDSSVEIVLSHVRQAIIAGRYPPNQKLDPRKIATECKVSFIPVREALRVLEAEGFVTFIHNKGAWVTPLSVTDLEDLYAIRIELEAEAVRQAAPFSASEIRALETTLDDAARATRRNDRRRVITLNRDFHFAIYTKSQSPRRLRLIEQMWQHADRYQRLSLNYRHDAADAEHRAIVAALADDDHRLAARELRTHLETTARLLRAALAAKTSATAPRKTVLTTHAR
jgi:DNA-binding GntR family transcriptional regulator